MPFKHLLASAAFIAALLVSPVSAETRTYSPNEMRALAAQASQRGAPAAALKLTEALLQRDPGDVEALLLHSRALRDLGRYDEAQRAGLKAWQLAQEKPRKYAAALAVAQAQSSAGRKTTAKLWLRRAVQHAPSAAARQQAIRDFKYLRGVTPLQLGLQLGITPNSNINNGSSNATSDLFGLPDVTLNGAAKALSGTEFSLGVSGRYRFSQTPTRASDLTFSAYTREYVLSSEAEAIAPDASASDFALTTLSAGLSHRRMNPQSRAETVGLMRLEATWYGRAYYSSALHGSLTQTVPLSARKHLQLRGTARYTTGKTAPKSTLLSAEVRYGYAFEDRSQLAVSFGVTNSHSPSASAKFQQARIGLDYTLAKPLLGAEASLGLMLRYRHYDSSPFLPSGARVDKEGRASLTLDFKNWQAYGFNPTLTLSASRARSNINLFETQNIGLAMGFQSSF